MNTIALSELDPSATIQVPFNGQQVSVTSPPAGSRIEILDGLRNPTDFHGPTDVDHVINFGPSLSSLIGKYNDSDGFFGEDRDGVLVLSNTSSEAQRVIKGINTLAVQMIEKPALYDDVKFCQSYYDLALEGYRLLPSAKNSNPIPVSLIRAGLVTTRLAHGLGIDARVENEIQVETKRAHPKDGNPEDILVTVRWANGDDPKKFNNADIEIADFVNPASWASTAALLLVLKHCHNSVPKSIEHRSFMGTMQGIMLAISECRAMGIIPTFKMIGITDTMNENYYLTGKISVGDAGDALRHFRPK